jgi:hypothetical protein
MTHEAIKELCKKATQEEMKSNWAMLNTGEKGDIIEEEMTQGSNLRKGVTCSTDAELHTHRQEKHRIMKVFGDFFGYPKGNDEPYCNHTLYGLRKKNHWDYDKRNFDVYECDVEMNRQVIECRLVISHYLLPVPDEDLGKGLSPAAIVEHDFTARMFDFDPVNRPHIMPLYVGDVFDFTDRLLKRAFAKYRKEKIAATAEKFGF